METVAQIGGSPRKSIFVYPADHSGSKSRSETPSVENLEVGLEPESHDGQIASAHTVEAEQDKELVSEATAVVVEEDSCASVEEVMPIPEELAVQEAESVEVKGDAPAPVEDPTGLDAVQKESPESSTEQETELAPAEPTSDSPIAVQEAESVESKEEAHVAAAEDALSESIGEKVEEPAPAESSADVSDSLIPPPPPSEEETRARAANHEAAINDAKTAKNEATEAYKKSDLMTARTKYLAALESLQLVQGELSNATKSTLFELTVTNNNNVALCSMGLEDYTNCIAFATNTLVLIRSLERNIPDGQIWQCLVDNGITLDQLQKVWKKKALYYIGKAQLKKKNFPDAIEALEEAVGLTVGDVKLAANTNELNTLLADAKARLAKEKQVEKNTWAKAFKKRTVQTDEEENTDVSYPSPSSPAPEAPVDINNLKFDWKTGKAESAKKASTKKAAQSSAVSTWTASSFFSQYGLYMGILGVGVVAGAAMWYTRFRRR